MELWLWPLQRRPLVVDHQIIRWHLETWKRHLMVNACSFIRKRRISWYVSICVCELILTYNVFHSQLIILQDALQCLSMAQLQLGKHNIRKAHENALSAAQKAYHINPGILTFPSSSSLIYFECVHDGPDKCLSFESLIHCLWFFSNSVEPLSHLMKQMKPFSDFSRQCV